MVLLEVGWNLFDSIESTSRSAKPFQSLIGIFIKEHWLEFLVVLVPMGYYAIQTQPLAGWIIDDAGITFSYARSFSQGHGFVSQPGMPPVEGYSNFLWLMAMVPFFLVGLFDPIITPKIISMVMVGLAFWVLHRIVMYLSDGRIWLSLVVLLLTATNASFVIWTCSGLENPLFVLLIVFYLYLQLRFFGGNRSSLMITSIGLIAAGIALTRPDGIMYLGFFPIIVGVLWCASSQGRIAFSVRSLSLYFVVAGGIYGAFLAFRYLYFGDVYPNTYYVKGGPSLLQLGQTLILQGGSIEKLRTLCSSLVGPAFWYVVPITLLAVVAVAMVKGGERRNSILATVGITGLPGFVYLLMAHDWMGEFRFATAFFPLYYVCLAVAVHQILINRLFKRRLAICLQIVVILTVVVLTVFEHRPRLKAYSQAPRVSFVGIVKNFGEKFNQYAEYLGIDNASLLVADIGGTLYSSKLKVHDLAGLCDRTIAKTRIKQRSVFHNYVFDTIRPTFLVTQGTFTGLSKFDDDPRFFADYTAIKEYTDPYLLKKYGVKRISGIFVRRDAITNQAERLDTLRIQASR